MKIFLGGTYGSSDWRADLIPMLEEAKIEYFNPVVDDWTPECQAEEERQKEICDMHLYVITSEMEGVYSIAEAVNDAHDKNRICLFKVIGDGFADGQIRSLVATSKLITKAGGHVCSSLSSNFDWVIKTIKELLSTKERHVVKALDAMDSPLKNFITIENAENNKGVVPIVKFQIQSDPISEVGINGCQSPDMLEYVKCLIESFNDKFPCRENAITITKLEEALMWQDARTKSRKKAGVEGFNKAMPEA